MKRLLFSLMLGLGVMSLSSFYLVDNFFNEDVSCKEVIRQMFAAIKEANTLRYKINASERVEGKIISAHSEIKLQEKPRKLYLKNPDSGVEVLWTEGNKGDMALVNPNRFPYINLDLDPYGSLMRSKQHHTIHELGFAFIGKIIATTILKDPAHVSQSFSCTEIKWKEKNCYCLIADFSSTYKYFEYTVGKKESVSSIADKFGIPDFKIRSKNDLKTYYGDIKEGKKLLIPTFYSKKTIVYIDKEQKLPIYIEAHDDEGLYESYDFSEIKVNSSISDQEFTKSYKDYHF